MRPGAGQAGLLRAGAAALTLLLMSYAWLAPGVQTGAFLGLPKLAAYFFGVWGLAIGLAAWQRPDA